MENFKWLLIKKYKEFNSNIVIKAVKESFTFNLLKALIIILLFTLLLFQVKPQKAYIYAELEQIETPSLQYQADMLEVSDILRSHTSVCCKDKIVIDLNGLAINDVNYFEGEYLEIYPAGLPSSFIGFSGSIVKAYFYNANSNINQYKIIYSNSSSYCFVGEQHLKIDYGTAYIVNTSNGERRKLDCTENLVLTNTMHKDIVNEYKELIDSITEDDGSISDEHENEYQNYIHIIDRFSNEEDYTVRVYAEPIDSNSRDAKLETSFPDFNNISSTRVGLCKVMADGILTISYTPTAEEYILKKQEINLLSEDSSLNISYDIENGTAFIFGYADDAILSQMSLFPSFWNWYFSNIYMAPLTLISTVFAAISMMNTSKKIKQDD